MSRGLGVIERLILGEIATAKRLVIDGEPGTVLLNSSTLSVDDTLPGHPVACALQWTPPPARRKAVLRAMHSFVRKFPQYALMGGQGRRKLYLYEPADPLSTLWAELNVNRRRRNPISFCEARAELRRRRERQDAPPVHLPKRTRRVGKRINPDLGMV
jgi:hypothetical protein